MNRTPQKVAPIGLAFALGVAGLFGAPASSQAGDPVPDVDVILEQIPGGVVAIEVRRPTAYDGDPVPDVDVILEQLLGFDAVRLSGDKALRDLSVVDLPTGWGLRRDGKRLVLSGPIVVPPVRFKLETRGERPERVTVELLRGKEVRVSRPKINPRIVPARVVSGTLTGTVRLPPQVSPGETLALRPLAGSNLPPGGTWVIAGTVSEPWNDDDLRHARAIVNTTRSHLKTRAASEPPPPVPPPLVLLGAGGCRSLAPLAAVLQARDSASVGGEPVRVRELEQGEDSQDGDRPSLADLSSRMRHDIQMSSIRNLKFFFAVADEPQRVARTKGEAWEVSSATTGSDTVAWTWAASDAVPDFVPGRVTAVALDGEPVAGGCRFVAREPSDLDLARWARMQAKGNPSGRPEGKPPAEEIYLVTLPADLRPGDRISARYLDEWGDPWVEVGEIPDVDVVPTSEDVADPFIESASAYAVAGDPVCVCGAFSALDAVARFTVASRPVDVVSISTRVAWLQTAPDGLGPALIRAEGFRGEAATELLRVRADLDQEHLFSGQTTPLRLIVEGSESALPIRIHNGTPQVIELEGGPEQETETSGGAVNQAIRQVRGLERGAFQLTWELRPSTCPCAESG